MKKVILIDLTTIFALQCHVNTVKAELDAVDFNNVDHEFVQII